MNKRINLIIGSGVLGAYLSAELLRKKEKVVVTTRSLKKTYINYSYLKIQKKVTVPFCYIVTAHLFGPDSKAINSS